MTGSRIELRDRIVDFLREEIIGPAGGSCEVLDELPTSRYLAGILFPPATTFNPVDDHADEDETEEPGTGEPDDEQDPAPDAGTEPEEKPDPFDEQEDDGTVVLANSFLPSALGISFVVGSDTKVLEVEVRTAVYLELPKEEGERGRKKWSRRELEIGAGTCNLDDTTCPGGREECLHENEKGKLGLHCMVHPLDDARRIVTVTLCNRSTARGRGDVPDPEACFFQVSIRVRGKGGGFVFMEYGSNLATCTGQDAIANELLYRNKRAFCVGHGCSGEWGNVSGDRADEVRTAVLPACESQPLKPRGVRDDAHSMEFLGGEGVSDPGVEIPTALETLLDDYRNWIEARESEAQGLPGRLDTAASGNLRACRGALARMSEGIDLLRRNALALDAFMMANRAMIMQQYHFGRKRTKPGEASDPMPGSYKASWIGDRPVGYWRSFQLAFILMNLGAFIDPDFPGEKKAGTSLARNRDIVDLIWFPTGGGKTEAYLGLAAFAILVRRLLDPANGGCTILMRYTLRLLTAQQFQRAASLICACEHMRRRDPGRLGTEPITIGLWVGESLTPNKRKDAVDGLRHLAKGSTSGHEGPGNPFQLLSCPWCGKALDERGSLGYRRTTRSNGVQGAGSVAYVCPAGDDGCTFSTDDSPLPVMVVDEDIYERPPTLLLGTVDKFAMLSWRSEAGGILGGGSEGTPSPPDLVIQDELHLISGPLGSMVGLYESAIDHIVAGRGTGPKIIASTATISRATEQCRALYNRSAFQFPPPGLDSADSFFQGEETGAPGRLFVGVFPSAASSPVTALVRTAASLLQGARSVTLTTGDPENTRDPYWTLVQYFGSLRELGRAATLVEDDIPDYLRVIARRRGLRKGEKRWIRGPVELTSRRTADEIPKVLEELSIPFEGEMTGRKSRPIDTLLATNMISVGVDVGRLGLMLVVGQPKTTSEYIQATSRVGRSDRAPGLVVTLFNAAKSRDRSHYEQFRSYHESAYRHVEPTSITPFAIPVLDRALHAVAVIVGRHAARLDSPSRFVPSAPWVAAMRKFLEDRVHAVDPGHGPELAIRLDDIIRHWGRHSRMYSGWGGFGITPEDLPLMFPSGEISRDQWNDIPWPTPTSMRNVDVECDVTITGRYEKV